MQSLEPRDQLHQQLFPDTLTKVFLLPPGCKGTLSKREQPLGKGELR